MNTTPETGADAMRAVIEQKLALYPDLQPDEIAGLVRYLKKDASALDRASIASNPDLQAQYRQFCHDQHFDRLRPFEIALIVAGVVGVIAVLTVIVLLRAG